MTAIFAPGREADQCNLDSKLPAFRDRLLVSSAAVGACQRGLGPEIPIPVVVGVVPATAMTAIERGASMRCLHPA
jgi:hypothetical protein